MPMGMKRARYHCGNALTNTVYLDATMAPRTSSYLTKLVQKNDQGEIHGSARLATVASFSKKSTLSCLPERDECKAEHVSLSTMTIQNLGVS